MSHSVISLGLGLGGGKSATSSGAPGGGGALENIYSVLFDGVNDKAPSDSNADLASATAWTLTAWFKTSDTDGGKEAIVGFGAGSPYFVIRTENTYTQMREQTYTTNIGEHSTSGWNFAAVYQSNDTTIKGMLNGGSWVAKAQVQNGASVIQATYGANPVAVGVGPYGSHYFPGGIDEVAYWNTALSESDLEAIYNSGVPKDISSYNPISWWRMGDNNSGSGTTITDMGSGSNDLTLVNGPAFQTDVP